MSMHARRGAAPAARPPIEFHAMPGARHFRAADLASWPTAQRRYRKLVHERHPDRRPAEARESAHAEFIEITAAFKRLRERYRREGLLPIAHPPTVVAANDATMTLRVVRSPPRSRPGAVPHVPADPLGGGATRPGGARPARRPRRGLVLCTALAVTAITVLIGFAVVLDGRQEQLNRDRERTLDVRR